MCIDRWARVGGVAVAFAVLAVAAGGCGIGSDADDGQEVAVLGSVTDGTGEGLPGAIVVLGASSKTAFTDNQGKADLGMVKDGTQMRVLAPGYLSKNKYSTDQSEQSMTQDEDPAPEKAPEVAITSLSLTASGISVAATITAATGRWIVDARAEILGTEDGVVLTDIGGGLYTGEIVTTQAAGASVLVFAVDNTGSHGEDTEKEGGGGPPGGSWTGSAENWTGSLYGNDHGSFNYGRFHFNVGLNVAADGTVDGIAAILRLMLLRQGFSPLVSETWTGSARVTGKNYQVDVSSADGKTSLNFNGTVSDDDAFYTGFVNGKVNDTPYQANFVLVNTYILGSPWTTGALASSWGWSFFYGNEAALDPKTYQYNVRVVVNGFGNVVAGTPCTLGATTAAGASLAFVDVGGQNLGYFTGAPGLILSSGATYDLYGFMAVGRFRVHGFWSSGGPSYGAFWGRKWPGWSLAALDAQWQGIFVVTGGPDVGNVLNAQVNINEMGQVSGVGSINGGIAGGNISLGSGSLSFSDASVGALVGSFSGSQGGSNVTVDMSTPAAPETASMGVYHGRMIGKFAISTNGDTGYYFLFRNSRR